jgi:serine/threonine protein kinase
VAPGQNDFRTLVDFGPAFWNPNTPIPGVFTNPRWNATNKKNSVPIDLFIDFALGACQAVELVHSGLRTIHGELRGDAFHFNKETKSVKLLHQGSGVRSFESAMTSSGWSEMAREIGTSHRLQYVAPEQTGRMPAEPDSRTDIYSLGVLFFTLLTGTPAVASITPIEVLQAIIGRKIPAVSSVRPNVPDAISRVVSKMVMKRMDERYNSLAGVREDLRTIQKYLEEGDEEALQSFQLGAKDLSSFFVLPNVLFGQEWEQQTILKVVQRVAHQQMPKRHFYSTSSSVLPFPDSRSDDTDDGSDGGSHPASPNSTGSQSIVRSAFLGENSSAHVDSQKTSKTDSLIGTSKASNFGDSFGGAPNKYSRRRPSQKIKRIERTNVIAIVGSAGTGKSTLVQSVQGLVRKNGYFASAKFDPVGYVSAIQLEAANLAHRPKKSLSIHFSKL